MKNAKAPASQNEDRNNGVIGIGTDGNPVDMDLWEYTLMEDGTYGLNDSNSLADIGKNKGYLGDFNSGKIIGKIPEYISTDNGSHFYAVTSMFATFCEVNELIEMPKIPSNVTDLTNAFIRCKSLKNISPIPSSVKKCGSTFKGCISLEVAPEIPNGIINIMGIFSGCTNLAKGPSVIPESVTNMYMSFFDCSNLTGQIILKANITGYPVISDDQNDFYRSFWGASLKENDASLKIILNQEKYELLTEQINKKVFQSSVSNIILVQQ